MIWVTNKKTHSFFQHFLESISTEFFSWYSHHGLSLRLRDMIAITGVESGSIKEWFSGITVHVT